jgi:toxin ParE1/3/4
MTPKIIVRPQAEADVEQLAAHIARRSLPTAVRFYRAAYATFEQLAPMPLVGGPCEFRNPEAAELGVWPVRGFRNHLIFYRPLSNGIDVVRVLHAARDLESIFAS